MKRPLHLRELWQPRAKQWWLAAFLGAITLGAAIALLAVSGWFISAAALAGLVSLNHAFTFNYFPPAALIRTLAMMRTAGRYGERLASHNAVLHLLRDLRCRFFAQLAASAQPLFFAQTMHRLTNDIDLLDHFPLRFVQPWLWALLLQSIFLCWLFWTAPMLAIVAAVPLIFAGILLPACAARRGTTLAQNDADKSEQRRVLLINPLRILTALLLWDRWENCRRDFLRADDDYSQLKREQQWRASFYLWLQQCVLAALVCALLWQAVPLLQAQILSVPLFLAMILCVFGLNEALAPLAQQFMALGFARAASCRLNALPVDITPSAVHLPDENVEKIIVTDLAARQKGALSGFEGVNFTLSRGESLIITGRSGCGKSTLLDVLAGELAPARGKILCDGAVYSPKMAHYLAQRIDIFDLSLADNLRLGDHAISDDALFSALEKVDLARWAQDLPQGLKTPLGEYGTAISGGQARRIALARLLLRPKPLLLLDEPFAGLDSDTRNRIWQSLCAQQQNGWLIVVSHHLPDNKASLYLDLSHSQDKSDD